MPHAPGASAASDSQAAAPQGAAASQEVTPLSPMPAQPGEQLGDLPAVVSLLPLPAVAFEQPLLSTELRYPLQVGSCPFLFFPLFAFRQTSSATLWQVFLLVCTWSPAGTLALQDSDQCLLLMSIWLWLCVILARHHMSTHLLHLRLHRQHHHSRRKLMSGTGSHP